MAIHHLKLVSAMRRSRLSIRQRLTLSLVGLVSIGCGLLLVSTEVLIRRDWLERHQSLAMETKLAIEQRLLQYGRLPLSSRSPDGQLVLAQALNDFSNTRVLVWFTRHGRSPLFPNSSAVQGFFADQQLLNAADQAVSASFSPRIFTHSGVTYVTCGIPLASREGVLRFLEDAGVDQITYRDNVVILIMLWIILVMVSVVLVRQLTRVVIGPLSSLGQMMDGLGLQSSGLMTGGRLDVDDQPRELKVIADSYNRLADRLQQSFVQQQLFMRALSHELMTPITLIGGNAKRLCRRCPDLPQSDRQLLISIEQEAGRIDCLVRNLLDLARNDSNGLYSRSDPFVLCQVVQDVVKDAISLPWGSRVRFESPAADDPAASAKVIGDPDCLRQCLLNVMENAAKYSASDKPIDVSISSANPLLLIRVRDYGPGIPVEERDLVFEPFYRSEQARSRQLGTGVGLAIVRVLMAQMGGRVAVLDAPQTGTTMQFELPVFDGCS